MADLGEVPFHAKEVKSSTFYWEYPETIREWCALPYPAHPRGCPNTEDCWCFENNHISREVHGAKRVHLAWVEFDIDSYEERMREGHPKWTKKQCRNLLYWQRGLRARLKKSIKSRFGEDAAFRLCGEGGGINFYRTMRRLGVRLDMPKDLHTVRIIAVVLE